MQMAEWNKRRKETVCILNWKAGSDFWKSCAQVLFWWLPPTAAAETDPAIARLSVTQPSSVCVTSLSSAWAAQNGKCHHKNILSAPVEEIWILEAGVKLSKELFFAMLFDQTSSHT